MSTIVIVAALERELEPLVRGWQRSEVRAQNRTIRIFQQGDTLVAFGGIGGNSARIAADAAYNHAGRDVEMMISAGLAGGLVPEIKVGEVLMPKTIIGDSDNNRIEMSSGAGTLVSVGAIAGLAHKKLFAEKYQAQMVDMEAFAVADVARIYNAPCLAVKAISDEYDFDLPPLGQFVTDQGEFRTSGFVAYAAVRPWTWLRVMRLNTNSKKASANLCRALQEVIKGKSKQQPR